MTELLLINPNTTASITNLVLKTARGFASRGTVLRAATGAFGPRYIASRAGYAIAGHAALDALANDSGSKDAVVLACFGDPGLTALKEVAEVPVIGMAEASILQACAIARRFSIVTGGERWKPMLEEFVAAQGLSARLASVRTVAPTGADIARNPKATMAVLAKGCRACVREDGAEAVILGGAGLVGLAARLKDSVDVPLLDGLACALSMAESLGRQKPGKASAGSLALPVPVESVGLSPALARLLIQGGDP
jgi:Asp/Glu/hydantoin racemase